MKTELTLIAALLLAGQVATPQGVFWFYNGAARTRLYSTDGPLAGTNIYAQMIAGAQPGVLTPVGPVDFHIKGIVSDGLVPVPDAPAYTYAYVQMAVWDSSLWGTSLAGVPADQVGWTDTVRVFLTTAVFPDVASAPRFTQPAVVPIPEPPVWALALLAGLGAWLTRFARREPPQPK